MDELTYLILDEFHTHTNYPWDAVRGAILNKADYFEFSEDEAAAAIGRMSNRKMIVELPGIAKGLYTITDEGRRLFLKEQAVRAEKQKAAEFQQAVSDSVLQANASVIQTNETVRLTNESVRQTNMSVQAINQIVSENIPRQNRIARSSVVVALFAAIFLLASLVEPIFLKSDSALLKNLEKTNQHLAEQNQALKKMLEHQTKVDSILLQRKDFLPGK